MRFVEVCSDGEAQLVSRTFALLAATILSFGCGPAPEKATDPRIISKSPLFGDEREAHLAIADNGFVAVVWIGGPASANDRAKIGYRFSRNGGETWEEVGAIYSPDGGRATDPSVAADAQGNFFLSWCNPDTTPGGSHVFVASAPAGTSAFGPAVDISGWIEGEWYDKPWITVLRSGTILVTYGRIKPIPALIVARSKDGQSWTRTELGLYASNAYPCASRTGNRIYVVFSGSGNDLRWSDDDGATWPASNMTVFSADQPMSDLRTCVSNENEIWVSWGVLDAVPSQGKWAKDTALYVGYSSDGGLSFQRTTTISEEGTFFMFPQIVREENGALNLLFYAGKANNDPLGSLRWARSTDLGASFGLASVVHQPITFSQDRGIDFYGDYFGVAWSQGVLYTAYGDNMVDHLHPRIAFERIPSP